MNVRHFIVYESLVSIHFYIFVQSPHASFLSYAPLHLASSGWFLSTPELFPLPYMACSDEGGGEGITAGHWTLSGQKEAMSDRNSVILDVVSDQKTVSHEILDFSFSSLDKDLEHHVDLALLDFCKLNQQSPTRV